MDVDLLGHSARVWSQMRKAWEAGPPRHTVLPTIAPKVWGVGSLLMASDLITGLKHKTSDNYTFNLFSWWRGISVQFSSVSQLCLTLWPHGLQHTMLPCPSPRPYSNSCLSSWWCHPPISSSVISFSCLQSFPASGSFPMSRFFLSGGQNFSFSISPSNEYSGLISFRMDWLDLLAVQGTLKSLLQYHSSKASILRRPAFFIVQLSHPHMTTGKAIALTRWTFVGKVMSLLFIFFFIYFY